MAGNYVPDYRQTGELARGREIEALVRAAAEDGMRFAETIAPVDTGEYRDSFVTDVTEEFIARERRAVAILSNTAEHAGAVEASTHVLSRTVDHIEQTYG